MSRTDKTDPYWVQSNRHPHRTIRHGSDCEEADSSYSWNSRIDFKPCDIHLANHKQRPRVLVHHVYDREETVYSTWSFRAIGTQVRHYDYWRGEDLTPGCDYHLPHYEQGRAYYRTPRHRDIKDRWYGPSRLEERAKLRDAVKDYNANGDTENVDLDHQQHRHGVSWYWD